MTNMNPQLTFFDTTNQPLPDLIQATVKANTQTTIVHAIFKKYRRLTASECWRIFGSEYCPQPLLTSCRRSITVLTNSGNLAKLEEKKKGMYGSPEHIYVFIK